MRIVNLDLMREPYNWIIVPLMVAFALVLLALIAPALPDNAET